MAYRRDGLEENLEFTCQRPAKRIFRLPMRGTSISAVTIDSQPVEMRIEPRIGHSDIVVETPKSGIVKLQIIHGEGRLPVINIDHEGHDLVITAQDGEVVEVKDPSIALSDVAVNGRIARAKCTGRVGSHTVFIRVRSGSWDGWLPADITIPRPARPPSTEPQGSFRSVDISTQVNAALTDIHQLDYSSPRPNGMALMTNRNGRYAWDDNNLGGPRTTHVDDSHLRNAGGTFVTPSGIPFNTPAEGKNALCVSQWDNFPDEVTIPLSGRGSELAILLIGVTNPMQSRVENGRFTVRYEDETEELVNLVNPVNFDDWMVAPTQRENETVYLSDFNHAAVQRIRLNPQKPLRSLVVRGTANEVIVGILGVAVRESPAQ